MSKMVKRKSGQIITDIYMCVCVFVFLFCRFTRLASERYINVTYCNFNNTLSFYLQFLVHQTYPKLGYWTALVLLIHLLLWMYLCCSLSLHVQSYAVNYVLILGINQHSFSSDCNRLGEDTAIFIFSDKKWWFSRNHCTKCSITRILCTLWFKRWPNCSDSYPSQSLRYNGFRGQVT